MICFWAEKWKIHPFCHPQIALETWPVGFDHTVGTQLLAVYNHQRSVSFFALMNKFSEVSETPESVSKICASGWGNLDQMLKGFVPTKAFQGTEFLELGAAHLEGKLWVEEMARLSCWMAGLLLRTGTWRCTLHHPRRTWAWAPAQRRPGSSTRSLASLRMPASRPLLFQDTHYLPCPGSSLWFQPSLRSLSFS